MPNADPIEPDIVLLSADEDELLVVDVKCPVPPFGVGYIHDDLLELEREKHNKGDKEGWKPKMNRYMNAFRESPCILSQHFTVSYRIAPRVYGLIVVRWPFPIPAEFGDELGAIDWPTLLENPNSSDRIRPFGELHHWIRKRPDVAIVQNLTWTEKPIRVEDWTYRYSVLSGGNRFD